MKRLLLIGFAALSLAFVPTLSASAMPIAHPNALTGDGDSTIQVHGWGHHHGWHHGWGHSHWGHRRGWGHRHWA